MDGVWSRTGGTCSILYLGVLHYQAHQLSTNLETGILYRDFVIRDLGWLHVAVFG